MAAVQMTLTDSIKTASNLMLAEMEDIMGTDMTVQIDDMQYEGFNPREFLAHLWATAERARISQEEHKRNIRSMACLGLIRGNKLKKMREGTNINLKTAVESWIKMYRLIDTKPQGGFCVTLARVSACLAMSLSSFLHREVTGLTGTIPAENICPGFPRSMAFSNFGALIPTDMDPSDLDMLRRAF